MKKNICSKCGSTNINYQAITNIIQENNHHVLLWWLIIGWWWIIIKWFFFTCIALFIFILKLCGIRKKKNIIIDRTRAVCQNCGNSWNL